MQHFSSISFKSHVLTSIWGAFWGPKWSQNAVRERSEWGSKTCQNFDAIFGSFPTVKAASSELFWLGFGGVGGRGGGQRRGGGFALRLGTVLIRSYSVLETVQHAMLPR